MKDISHIALHIKTITLILCFIFIIILGIGIGQRMAQTGRQYQVMNAKGIIIDHKKQAHKLTLSFFWLFIFQPPLSGPFTERVNYLLIVSFFLLILLSTLLLLFQKYDIINKIKFFLTRYFLTFLGLFLFIFYFWNRFFT